MNSLLGGGLLAASMLLGQTPEPPAKNIVPAPPAIQPTQPSQRPILGFFSREDRPIINKISGWFKRDQPDANQPGIKGKDKVIRDAPPPMPTPNPAAAPPASSDFPRRLPNPTSKAPTTPEPL